MIYWDVDPSLLSSPAITNRNLLAEKYVARSAEEMIAQYSGLTPDQVKREFTEVFNVVRRLGVELNGTGMELGAGVGVLSAVAARFWDGIDQLYAIEVVPKVTELLQPLAVRYIAQEAARKITGVVGSFDNMNVPDAYFDFGIEYASLHHSNDLRKTLREVARVLKPGAPLIAIDRVHHNGVSDEQLRFMLDVEYSADWKRQNGYSEARLNRAQNGEHEIRREEWVKAFNECGFDLRRRIELRPVSMRLLLYKMILMLPFRLRKTLDLYPSRVRPTVGEILWRLGMLFGVSVGSTYAVADREHSLFVAIRR